MGVPMDIEHAQMEQCTHNVEGESSSNPATPTQVNDEFDPPRVGIQFETHEEARSCYENYGRRTGFSIRLRSSIKSINHFDEVSSYKFVCSCEGQYMPKVGTDIVKKRSTSTVRMGCMSRMWIVKDRINDKWKITQFSDEHNHKLVTPQKRIYLKCNRKMPDAAKSLVEIFSRENLQVNKVTTVLGGDTIGFNERDCWNHLRSVRQQKIGMGDAQSVLDYFQKRQIDNPQFFYVIQCDEEGRAANFFWVDAQSLMAYKRFGDVVTFDTTYRSNKYDMPFAPFTGVNHHFQSIQFGCALLQDETETTFVWLFKTWLQAMGGSAPISLITDQDLAMKNAIAKVFPTTRHRLCIWHIMKKFGEKLSHVYADESRFKTEIGMCIWNTYNIEKFEERWNILISEYGLTDNEWLNHLYVIRTSWVPTYNRTTFFAGMNTTSRSEGTNAFFDGFMSCNSSLVEFVMKYEKALKHITKREQMEDYMSEHKRRIINNNYLILRHASQVFTKNIFDKFKPELDDIVKYKIDEDDRNGEYHTYIVKSKVDPFDVFLVKMNLENYKGSCGCHHFEFIGILCRHILAVFYRQDVDEIPAHFILKRWTQGANRFKVDDVTELMSESHMQSKVMRLSHMCREATQLACMAQHSEEGYKIVIEMIKEASRRVSEIKPKQEVGIGSSEEGSTPHATKQSPCLLLNPNVSQTKGRKKNEIESVRSKNIGRLKSSIELSQEKKKRKCALCKKSDGHDKRNCPMNSNQNILELNKQVIEIGDVDSEAIDLD